MGYLNVCTPSMNIQVPALGWLSASELWNAIMVASGSNPDQGMDRHSLSPSRSEAGVKRPCQILVVEDSKPDVYLIREAISSAGVRAELHIVHDGHTATEFIDAVDRDPGAASPNLVLLDLNLPKKNGDEVLKHLRQSPRCQNAQVLVVSSSDAPRDRGAVEMFSIAGYFRKPSEYDAFMKLGNLVKELLGKSMAKGECV